MAVASLIVTAITIYILYDAAFAEESARLIESDKNSLLRSALDLSPAAIYT